MKAKILIPVIIGTLILITVIIIFFILALKVPVVNKTYEVTNTFTNINIDVSTSDIEFAVSEDSTVKVEVTETPNKYHTIEVINGVLTVKCIDKRNFYEKFFNFKRDYKATIYMPAVEYDNLTVKSSTGNVTIPEGFTFNKIDLKLNVGDTKIRSNVIDSASFILSTGNADIADMTLNIFYISSSVGDITLNNIIAQETITVASSTGDTTLNNIKCKSLDVTSSTGNIELTDTIADDTIALSASVGDIFINDSDAGTINIKTSTGDVNGTFLTNKIIFAETELGNVNVPHLTTGGKCKIKTSTGDIKISIKE